MECKLSEFYFKNFLPAFFQQSHQMDSHIIEDKENVREEENMELSDSVICNICKEECCDECTDWYMNSVCCDICNSWTHFKCAGIRSQKKT